MAPHYEVGIWVLGAEQSCVSAMKALRTHLCQVECHNHLCLYSCDLGYLHKMRYMQMWFIQKPACC